MWENFYQPMSVDTFLRWGGKNEVIDSCIEKFKELGHVTEGLLYAKSKYSGPLIKKDWILLFKFSDGTAGAANPINKTYTVLPYSTVSEYLNFATTADPQ